MLAMLMILRGRFLQPRLGKVAGSRVATTREKLEAFWHTANKEDHHQLAAMSSVCGLKERDCCNDLLI